MTPPDDVSERVERIKADLNPTPEYRGTWERDAAYLLSLVEEVRDQLCKYTCQCGPASNPDPKEHADYCLYRRALRDAEVEE